MPGTIELRVEIDEARHNDQSVVENLLSEQFSHVSAKWEHRSGWLRLVANVGSEAERHRLTLALTEVGISEEAIDWDGSGGARAWKPLVFASRGRPRDRR